MVYFYVILILLAETFAISFLKEYSLSHHMRYFALGAVLYVGVAMLLIPTFHYDGMGVVNVLWSAFSVILVAATGHFCFHESVTRREVIGIGLVIVGVAILPMS